MAARHGSDPVATRLRARDPPVAVVVPPRRPRTPRRRGTGRTPHAPGRPHVRRLRPPQPTARFPRLPFQPPEPVEVAEGEPGVRVAVAPPDDLRVREGAVAQIDVGEGAAVPVSPLAVVRQADRLPLEQTLREGARLPAEELDRPPRVDRLGRVDADSTARARRPGRRWCRRRPRVRRAALPQGAPRGGARGRRARRTQCRCLLPQGPTSAGRPEVAGIDTWPRPDRGDYCVRAGGVREAATGGPVGSRAVSSQGDSAAARGAG